MPAHRRRRARLTRAPLNSTHLTHPQVLQEHQAAPVPPPANAPLTLSALAAADPSARKSMIGERLYPLIAQSEPGLAGKITGMLLELDDSELLHLLASPYSLLMKIEEAIMVCVGAV